MPDPKKLAVLEGVGYQLRETCFSCIHFVKPVGWVGNAWGSCGRLPPTHAKHTDGARVSVRLDGWCPGYETASKHGVDIARSGFARFIKDDKPLFQGDPPHGG